MSLKETSMRRIGEMLEPRIVAEHEANFLISLAQGNDDEAFDHYSKKLQSLYQLSHHSSIQISEFLRDAIMENDPEKRHDKLVKYYGRINFDSGIDFDYKNQASIANQQFDLNSSILNSHTIGATTSILGLDPEGINGGLISRNNAMEMVVDLHRRLQNTSAIVFGDSGVIEYENVGVMLKPTQADIENIKQQLESYYKQVKHRLNQK